MGLTGATVVHAHFGPGQVLKQENGYLWVRFAASQDEKLFVYPDAFGDFLSVQDEALAAFVEAALQEKRRAAAQAQAARLEKLKAMQEQVAAEKTAARPARAKTAAKPKPKAAAREPRIAIPVKNNSVRP